MARTIARVEPGQGSRLREMREELGLSQAELANRMGMDRINILRLESGQNKATSHAVRLALARSFGLSAENVDRLLRGEIDVKAAMKLRGPHSARRTEAGRRRRTGTEG